RSAARFPARCLWWGRSTRRPTRPAAPTSTPGYRILPPATRPPTAAAALCAAICSACRPARARPRPPRPAPTLITKSAPAPNLCGRWRISWTLTSGKTRPGYPPMKNGKDLIAMQLYEHTLPGGARLVGYLRDTTDSMPGYDIRPAVVVLPGGGYAFCSPREADPVATAFLAAGYAVFTLYYTVTEWAPAPLTTRPLADAARA